MQCSLVRSKETILVPHGRSNIPVDNASQWSKTSISLLFYQILKFMKSSPVLQNINLRNCRIMFVLSCDKRFRPFFIYKSNILIKWKEAMSYYFYALGSSVLTPISASKSIFQHLLHLSLTTSLVNSQSHAILNNVSSFIIFIQCFNLLLCLITSSSVL